MSLVLPEKLMLADQPRLTVPGLLYDVVQPRDFQIIDAAFLCLVQRGLVAEYPGAGKKLIAIMASLKLFSLMRAKNALIVSLGADCDQWVEEISEFTDHFNVQLYRGSPTDRRRMRGEDFDFRVTTYHAVAADLPYLAGKHDIVILDELSFLKNPETHHHAHLRAFCAPALPEQAAFFRKKFEDEHPGKPYPGFTPLGGPSSYVWGLTATPYETSPVDIFSLFWILQGNKSVLGTSYGAFKTMYCHTRKFTIRVPKRDARGRPIRDRTGKPKMGRLRLEKVIGAAPENLPVLREKIKPFYIRHPWEVIEKFLPELTIIPHIVQFGSRQRKRYLEISEGDVIADYVFMERGRKIQSKQVSYALKNFYQLRCCDGLLSLPGQAQKDSIKRDEVMKFMLGELSSEKVLLFSRFHQPLDELEERFRFEDIPFCRIDGRMDDTEQTRARKLFWDPKGAQVCLITEAGRMGLNLHCANYMIAYNTLYNPKKLEQLYGRIRRPGSSDSKIVYHLLVEGSVEIPQWEILREREGEFGVLFGTGENDLFQELDPDSQRKIVEYGLGGR